MYYNSAFSFLPICGSVIIASDLTIKKLVTLTLCVLSKTGFELLFDNC